MKRINRRALTQEELDAQRDHWVKNLESILGSVCHFCHAASGNKVLKRVRYHVIIDSDQRTFWLTGDDSGLCLNQGEKQKWVRDMCLDYLLREWKRGKS
jgi:hypothetical protein